MLASCIVIWPSIPTCKIIQSDLHYSPVESQSREFHDLTCVILGWRLDLYGIDGHFLRSVLQTHLWCSYGDYTWGYSGNDFISGMFLQVLQIDWFKRWNVKGTRWHVHVQYIYMYATRPIAEIAPNLNYNLQCVEKPLTIHVCSWDKGRRYLSSMQGYVFMEHC